MINGLRNIYYKIYKIKIIFILMSLNIITIGSAFYGNMDDRNLYQCMVDSKLKNDFYYINCFHFDEKFNSKGIPKYINKKYHYKKAIFDSNLNANEIDVYNVYNDNIIHTFYGCNIYSNNIYLMNIIQNMINNNEYIIISLFTGQIFLYEAIKFLGFDKKILEYTKLNILCNGCYSKLNNPENYNFISNNRFFSIYFYEYYNDKDFDLLVKNMGNNNKFKQGVQYYVMNDLNNGGIISTYLSIINSSNDDNKNIEYLKNVNRDYVIKNYNGNNLKSYIYIKLIKTVRQLNYFIDLNDSNFLHIKKSIDNYISVYNV